MKKSKPDKEPSINKLELQTAAPEASVPEPPIEPAHYMPMPTADPPANQAADGSVTLEASSPAKTNNPRDADVEITKTSFTEPGRPTMLAKCSAKEEHLERRKVRFDIADYTHMSIGEVFLDILAKCTVAVTSKLIWWSKCTRNLRYKLFPFTELSLLCQPPSLAYDEYAVDLEQTYKH